MLKIYNLLDYYLNYSSIDCLILRNDTNFFFYIFSGVMGEWEGLLEKRLATLPGSRHPGGGPLLIIPLPSDPAHHDVGGISATIKYLKTIPR